MQTRSWTIGTRTIAPSQHVSKTPLKIGRLTRILKMAAAFPEEEDDYMNFVSYEDDNGEQVYQYAGQDIDKLCNSFGHRDRRAKMVMLDKTLVRQTVPLFIFMGDSYLLNYNGFAGSEKHWDADNFIDLYPHKTMVATRTDEIPIEGFSLLEASPASVAQGKVLARGGLTWNGCLEDEEIVGRWASEVPKITIVHLGACDLANTDFGKIESGDSIGNRYGQLVMDWIPKFINAAAKTRKTNNQKLYFLERLKHHRWVILKIPSWGTEDEAIKGGMTAKEFMRLKRKANKGLDDFAKRLYEKRRAFVYGPKMYRDTAFRRTRHGQPTVHLDYRSQTIFIDQVIEAVARIICQCCCTFTKDERIPKEQQQLYDNTLYCPGESEELTEFRRSDHRPDYPSI